MSQNSKYKVLVGPEGLLPPAAATVGCQLPEDGEGNVEGEIVPEEEAMRVMATKMLTRRVPTLFPGPMIIWGWTEHTQEKAKVFHEIAAEIPGVRIIPMTDYRPIYPKIDPEAVINPCHPNLTIWHNKIEVCIFIGVHCHFANITLKMIRAGTNCYTIALCAEAGHEDAMASLPKCDLEKLIRFRDMLRRVKKEGVKPLYEGKGIIPSGWSQRAALEGLNGSGRPAETAHALEAAPAFSGELHQGLDENEE